MKNIILLSVLSLFIFSSCGGGDDGNSPQDLDGDGYSINDDCDDNNAAVNPGETEIPYNGIDDDCDPLTLDNDLDQDTYSNDVDCDDTEPDVYPGAPEIDNEIDDNCNGLIDEGLMDSDGDGIFDDIDNCIMLPNLQQSDIDGDGIGDLCDSDFITASNVGIGNLDPQTKFHLTDGELFVDKENGGIILRVDDSNCWRISVDTVGSVLTTRVDCP